MPINAAGSLAKNFSTCPRFKLRRSTTSPAALRPCTSNTFFAISSPIMLAFSMDGPLSLVAVCPEPVWHTDAGWGPSTPSSRAQRGTFVRRRERSLAALGMTTGANQVLYQRRLACGHFHDHFDRVLDPLARVFDGGLDLRKPAGVGLASLCVQGSPGHPGRA